MYFLILKINNFRGDLSDIWAETATLNGTYQSLSTLALSYDHTADHPSPNTTNTINISSTARYFLSNSNGTSLALAEWIGLTRKDWLTQEMNQLKR